MKTKRKQLYMHMHKNLYVSTRTNNTFLSTILLLIYVSCIFRLDPLIDKIKCIAIAMIDHRVFYFHILNMVKKRSLSLNSLHDILFTIKCVVNFNSFKFITIWPVITYNTDLFSNFHALEYNKIWPSHTEITLFM